jgi:hypothetical protein
MAYDNNINPGNPPIVWSSVKDAFDKVNENFTIIGSTLARERQLSIAHIESGTVNSNPVRVVTTELHDLTDNQVVNIFSSGVSQLDGNEYYVKKESDTEVFLYTDQLLTTAVNGTAFDTYASGGGFIQGGSEYASLDFENLSTNVSPNSVATFNLGSVTKPWKSLYTGEHADNDANAFNGVWLGSAQIKGKPGGIIDLPLGSTVNGSLIINPDQTFFKSVQVDSGNQVVADDFVDTLNLISGTAISMAVDSAAESITITNTGVTQLTAGLGLGISSATGNVTVTNTGVRSIQSTTALPSGRAAGAGINIDNSTGDNVKITNAGVLEIQPGSAALTVFTDAATGIVTITNASPAGNAYRTVDVKGTFLAAPSIAGTLVVEEGNGIVLTGNSGTQTLNIAFSGQSDITGSVFADDSTVLVDAVDGKIVGPVEANVTGDVTGSVFADDSTLLVDGVNSIIYGTVDANIDRGTNAFTLDADSATIEVAKQNDLILRSLGNTANAQISITGDTELAIISGNGSLSLSSGIDVDIVAATTIDLTATNGIDINSPVNTVITAAGFVGDLTGSVFGDDSTKLVDGAEGKIVGPVESDNIRGSFIGTVFSDDSSVVINEEGTVLGTIAPGAAAPASETEAAPVGEIRVDDNYVYVRKSAGWGKIAIGGWV